MACGILLSLYDTSAVCCLSLTSCPHVCAHVCMLHHAFVRSGGVRTLVGVLRKGYLNVTSQTNKSICVADSACDVARCELCNQLSEPALSANLAVHL